MCYAYRDTAKSIEEKLVNHIMDTARICLKRWELEALARKISRLLKVGEPQLIKESITLSALLHDIGKAAKVYQDECSKGSCKHFEGHYLISAFITHYTLSLRISRIDVNDVASFLEDKFDVLEENKALSIMIVLPIAFHHYHQVKGFMSYNVLKHRIVESFLDEPIVDAECVDDLKRSDMIVISEKFRDVIASLPTVLAEMQKHRDSDNYRRSKMFIEDLYRGIVLRDIRVQQITLGKNIVEAIAGLINLCDGWAASQTRRVARV
jgi:CRISPR-associated endonuclease Cas3-HD